MTAAEADAVAADASAADVSPSGPWGPVGPVGPEQTTKFKIGLDVVPVIVAEGVFPYETELIVPNVNDGVSPVGPVGPVGPVNPVLDPTGPVGPVGPVVPETNPHLMWLMSHKVFQLPLN